MEWSACFSIAAPAYSTCVFAVHGAERVAVYWHRRSRFAAPSPHYELVFVTPWVSRYFRFLWPGLNLHIEMLQR